MDVTKLKKELKKYASEKRRKNNERFFKTGLGEYGAGDKFIGVQVPVVRKVAKQFVESEFKILKKLLDSSIHEERLLALLILKEQNQQAIISKDRKQQNRIVRFYLKNSSRVNNWDLVDLSAHHILGQAILDGIQDKNILDQLVISESIWERRIAIVATFSFIRQGKILKTLQLSKKLLKDKEDLIHKAAGWMLREAWKKENEQTEYFLIKNYPNLPRTTLRYAIEKMSAVKRKNFLKGKF